MKKTLIAFGCTLSLLCSSVAFAEDSLLGVGLGALAGAAVGGQLGPSKQRGQNALIGAAIGAVAGYGLTKNWNAKDDSQLNNVYESGATNTASTWEDPDSRTSYRAVPVSTYRNRDGRPCRNVEVTAYIDGREELMQTRACRNAQGVWEAQR